MERGNKAWKLQVGDKNRGGQPGPAEASSGPSGSGGGGAAEKWEAEGGLSGSGGFFFLFIKEASGYENL